MMCRRSFALVARRGVRCYAATVAPDPSRISASLERPPPPAAQTELISSRLPRDASATTKRFREFDLGGKVFVVTGGGRGLGLTMAESLVEAGGKGTYATVQF